MIEFIIAMIENIKGPIGFATCLIFIGLIGSVFGCQFAYDVDFSDKIRWDNRPFFRTWRKIFGILLLPALLISCIPNVEDLWRVRIGLIKFELASPENVSKATETIERIGVKLECKYLGCEEKGESK